MVDTTSDSADADSRVSASTAVAYWSDVPATVDGMLGGYSQISRIDLRGSLNFIEKLRRSGSTLQASEAKTEPQWLGRGVDCGAGIGRITQGALMKMCKVVDLVEPVAKFAEEARISCSADSEQKQQLGEVFVSGLENWHPEALSYQYDLIWHQWCIGHLKNAALVEHLQRCKQVLKPGGWIVAKENVSNTVDLYDEVDSSVTRTDATHLAIFKEAGLKVVRNEVQNGFPKSLGLYPVRFYALQP